MSSIITLKGNSIATLQNANNIGSATQVQVTNKHTAALTLTVATVGNPGPGKTFPGTIVLAPSQTILLEKGPTDTIAGGTAGQLVATAVAVTR